MRAADAGHAAVSALAVGARVARRAAVLPLPMRTPLPHVTTTAGPSPVLAPAVECGATREASWLLRRSKDRFVSRDRGFQEVFMCTLRFGTGSGVTKNFHLASRDEPCLGGLNSVNGSRRRKNTFRGVFSERAARREPQARRAPERAVLETPARLRPFRARRRHALARPSRSARRSSENRSLPSAVGASQADLPVGPGVRITCDMTSHDKVRRESLRCAEALFTRREARTNGRGDARARPVSAPAHRRFAKALR